jgi:maltose alpha-D-glucosyltransferase / alpha-amylase
MNNTTDQSWYRNAIFYSLDVESFYDSNGDGIGDFIGLTRKLDYLAGLGINCIWLLPFYPSPNRDNGYDVMDYYNVDPPLGTLGDFALFMERASQLGIKVIIDLVVNHTSIQHPWFREARKSKDSPFHDFYVWSDEPKKFDRDMLMFEGEEDTIWSYDEAAGKYYLHRFYKEQPDLNLGNRAVQEEILKIMGYWLKLGVSGFRIDAAEIMIEIYGLNGVKKDELHQFFCEMLDFARSRKRDVLLLAEVNGGPTEMETFLREGRHVQMVFNFYINQHIFLSMVQQHSKAISRSMRALPDLSKHNLYLNFLRHHDELNLKLLKEKEMNEVFEHLAPDEDMRVFGFGVRRRLSPLFNDNQDQLKLAYSLSFTMPGAVMIRYGEEIGMGDDLSLEGRTSVRTPMQWTRAKNGGFSKAEPGKLVHPVISEGKYGYENVNVMQAQHDPSSLLNWVEKLVTTRKQCPEIGYGSLKILKSGNDHLLFHSFEWNGSTIYLLHNFSGEAVSCNRKKLFGKQCEIFNVMSDVEIYEDSDSEIFINAYGYRWFRLQNIEP